MRIDQLPKQNVPRSVMTLDTQDHVRRSAFFDAYDEFIDVHLLDAVLGVLTKIQCGNQ